MSIVRRIAKNTLISVLGEFIGKFMLFFLTVILARYLGSAKLGVYSFVFSFASLFYVVADMGLNKLALRDLSSKGLLLGKYFFNIIWVKLILAFFTFLFVSIVLYFVSINYEVKILIYFAVLYMLLGESLATLFRNIFVVYEKMEYDSLLVIIEKLIILVMGYFIIVNGMGLFWLMIVFVFAALIKLCFSLIIILYQFKPKFSFDVNFFMILVKSAFPFCLTYLLAILYIKIDIVMLSFIRGDTVVGWYTAAYNIIFALMLIPGVFMRAVFPNMSRSYLNSRDKFLYILKLSIKYLLIFAIPLVIGGVFISKEMIFFIYGATFSNSVVAFQILLFVLLFYFIKLPLNNALYCAYQEKKIMWIYFFGVLLNIFLNLILIPQFSYVGAGISTVITEIVVVGLILYLFKSYICNVNILRYFVKPVISSFVMISVLFFLSNPHFILNVIVGFVMYFIVLFLINGLDSRDIKLIKEIFYIKK